METPHVETATASSGGTGRQRWGRSSSNTMWRCATRQQHRVDGRLCRKFHSRYCPNTCIKYFSIQVNITSEIPKKKSNKYKPAEMVTALRASYAHDPQQR